MAIVIEEVATPADGGLTTSEVSITLSGTPADGELIVLGYIQNDGGGANDDSSGQTGIGPFSGGPFDAHYGYEESGTGPFIRRVDFWVKEASSEAGASYSVGGISTTSGARSRKTVMCWVISGLSGYQVEDSDFASNMAASQSTVTVPAVSYSENDTLLLSIGGQVQEGFTGGETLNPSASWTDDGDYKASGTGDDLITCSASWIKTSSGSQAITWTSDESHSKGLIAGTLAINVASGGPSGQPIAIRGVDLPGMRQWHPRRGFGFRERLFLR